MSSTDQSAINSVSSNLLSKSLQDVKQSQDKQAPAKEAKDVQPPQNQQSSTIVKISAEGQQLSRAEARNTQNAKSQNNDQSAKQNAEPPGIKFMESKSHGGRVSTYA